MEVEITNWTEKFSTYFDEKLISSYTDIVTDYIRKRFGGGFFYSNYMDLCTEDKASANGVLLKLFKKYYKDEISERQSRLLSTHSKRIIKNVYKEECKKIL